MTLTEAYRGDTDKGSAAHNYLPVYERHLEPAAIETLIEIGVWTGGSLRMWARWLPHADIYGIDIEPANYIVPSEPGNNPENVTFVEGDATLLDPWPADVVIDDGSHHGDDQIAAWDSFWPLLRSGGWYVIEDLETVFHDEFRSGPDMVEFFKHRATDAIRHGGQLAELHAYEQILFMRKA